MNTIGQAIRFAFGLLIGLVGLIVLTVALWIADQEYFGLMNTGVFNQTFKLNGNVIPVPLVLAVLGVIASVLLAFALLIAGRNYPFASQSRSS